MMDKDHFLLLVTKVLSGNALPGDEELLEHTLASEPYLQALYEQYKGFWEHQQANQSAAVEKALLSTWQKIQDSSTMADAVIEGPVRRRFTLGRVMAAAVLLGLVLMAGWFWWPGRRQAGVEWVETYNPKGIRSSILLPDGSKVWLAADSRLKYPVILPGINVISSWKGGIFRGNTQSAETFCGAIGCRCCTGIGYVFRYQGI
ncbi:hypothetical protein [Paraflavitalea speifideaquila]|uniref:hypothetical protein n=1 Tax=Paraflavitalea speifideaquila TaxID=3076558 RepID=UPI0028EE3C3A|nr:hypothetical protein [Paraflavitalea speifideiaquila]